MILRFGPNKLNAARFELRRSGRKVHLASRPMELLLLLIRRPGELVSREEIARSLWPGIQVEDLVARINTAVAQIRAAIQEDASKPRYLETVIGKGYRFIGSVAVTSEIPMAVDSNIVLADTGFAPSTHNVPVGVQPEAARTNQVISAANRVAIEDQAEVDFAEAAVEFPVVPAPIAAGRPAFGKHILWTLTTGGLVLIAAISAVIYRAQVPKKVSDPTPALVPRQITTNDAEHLISVAQISPDGERVAYMDPTGVFIQELATGRTRLVSGPILRSTRLLWFPDESKILLTGFQADATQPEIWILSASGAAAHLFRRNADNGAPSPDGRSIAFTVEDNHEIRLANPDGTDERYVTRGTEGELLDKLFWSPNSRRVNFQQRDAKQSPTSIMEYNFAWTFHSVDIETGHDTVVTEDVGFDSAGETADGTLFFLRRVSDNSKKYNGIWVVKTDPTTGGFVETPHRVEVLSNDSLTGLSVARDGRVTVIKHVGQQNIYYGQLKPSNKTLLNVKRLTSDVASDYPHAWSADGKMIYFESNRVGGNYHIFRQLIDSAHAEMITVGDREQFFPAIMPDGATLVYEEWTTSRVARERIVYKAQADGSAPKPVWQGAELDEWRCPAVSGTTCVLRTLEGQKLLAFYELNLNSGKGRELAHTAWEPTIVGDWALSPDGKIAAIPSHALGAPAIRLVALDGSQKESIISVHQTAQLWGIHWAPDGQGFLAEVRSGLSHRLAFISRAGDVSVIRQTTANTWGIPSRDGSKLAFVDSVQSQNILVLE